MEDGAERTIAITGANGFLGARLSEGFERNGWHVSAVVRPGRGRRLPNAIRVFEARLDAAQLAAAFEGADIVVHAAAVTKARSQAAFDAVNVAGTEAVVEAANRVGARVLLVSSQAAAGVGPPSRPSIEDDEPRPMTAYGVSKLAAERALQRLAREPWFVVRPSAVYGPGDRQFLPLFRLASRGWFPLVANTEAAYTLLYVDDFVDAMLVAARSLVSRSGVSGGGALPGGECVFLGHPHAHTTEDVLRQIGAAVEKPYRPLRVPPFVLGALAWAGDVGWAIGKTPLVDSARLAELRAAGFVCSVDRARAVLEFSAAVDFEEGARRTARWYREQARL